NRELVNVEVRDLTLNDIEHRIVRPIWRDPRTHYAVNCASIGCPNLQTTAFTGEASLSKAAVAYIDHNRGVTVAANGLVVSSIYEWFKEDFGGTDEGIIEHLKKYAEPSLFKLLTEFAEIVDDEYDGSLNDA
ncbi:MAG: DUF547 domain-containing protein, partial [Gammaproteobacteria bacterium]|nr:DUF547 domain-containing protein [Gammaproteobacteria bacterium]